MTLVSKAIFLIVLASYLSKGAQAQPDNNEDENTGQNRKLEKQQQRSSSFKARLKQSKIITNLNNMHIYDWQICEIAKVFELMYSSKKYLLLLVGQIYNILHTKYANTIRNKLLPKLC